MPDKDAAPAVQAFLDKYCIELANKQLLDDFYELLYVAYTEGRTKAMQYCIMLIERAMVQCYGSQHVKSY